MIILGLNAFYADSAACLIVDGKLIAAAEEGRFRRINHWGGLPTNAIDYCLRTGRLNWGDVDHIAINQKPGANNWRRVGFALTHRPHPKLIWEQVKNSRRAALIKKTLEEHYQISIEGQIHHVEHHLAHIASAFLVSGFKEAACLSVDGGGDFASTAFGFGDGGKIRIDNRIYFPHSLGIFYSALTQFLGFPNYGDEHKVMELAAHGEPSFLDHMRDLLWIRPNGMFRLSPRYFRHLSDNPFYNWRDDAPHIEALYRPVLADLLGAPRKPGEPLEQRHKDIAKSVQTMYEKAFFALLHALHKQHPSDHLALAGSCAMNAVANGKVYRRTPFKKMYLPAATGDAGGAIGAATYTLSQINNQGSHFVMENAYLGPESSQQEIHALLDWKREEVAKSGCSIALIAGEEELLHKMVQAINDGKVVGWFQGRMEWGPQALGNRSVLADPRRADMKEIVNARMKRNESFRPFAASILREAVSEWFEQDDDVPYMNEVFQVRPKHRALVPAVAHVDDSGRLQTVQKETNPRYHALISEFFRLSGVPMLLSAPFCEDEPIPCYPEDALGCFLRTEMDVLVLGAFYLQRK